MRTVVVIPAYRVKKQITQVIENIGEEVHAIVLVDDACPENTGQHVKETINDDRVTVITHKRNLGVGGAVLTGWRYALDHGADLAVKLDGDGQMDPKLIPRLINPILRGKADYTKGNRFFSLEFIRSMPFIRKLGNSILSFVNKFTSGYWNLMDPTNGYTAIHTRILPLLDFSKINNRFFFESDVLFRLNTIRAVVKEIPMPAIYGDEKSNLNIIHSLFTFPPKYFKCFIKRVFYTYFLRDFSAGSLSLILGTILLLFGTIFGIKEWYDSINTGITASTGTVMLAALPTILGFQLLLSLFQYDYSNIPTEPLHKSLE